MVAEQAVLGGMLLDQDQIDRVAAQLTAADFYRPVHQTIYAAILDLHQAGNPTDALAVAAHLGTARLVKVGGAPYLHTLISSVPTAANAGYYARIVAEQAVLRRLDEAGTRIVQLADAAARRGLDLADAVHRARWALWAAVERHAQLTGNGTTRRPEYDAGHADGRRAAQEEMAAAAAPLASLLHMQLDGAA
ncbi:MAG: hypothetical protein DLM59_18515 [Pseudonocardiales bacterium]|nr:MAG: hypothetical protein DLM59_18515 [Pseudonocardiales bacterium]